MEYGNINIGGGQPNYVQHPQEPARVSVGCNPQHAVNTFPGTESNTTNRNYATYAQNYPSHEYSGSQNSVGAIPSLPYQQAFPPEGHSQNLTLNQLLQQCNTSGTYHMRAMHNPQAPYRSLDPYGYPCKPGVPTCVTQDRTQTNPYPFTGPQRYADTYVRPYPSYPPGSNYPYNYHAQPIPPQRHRATAQQMSVTDYSNISSPNQPRPPSVNSSNVPERPSSRNVALLSGSSQSPQNAPHSPVYSGASQSSPWSPHHIPFGSPPQQQQCHQTRPRSLSRDYQHKGGADMPESATKSDNQPENTSKTVEDTGSRPLSRISESGASVSNSGLKDQSDDANSSSLDNLIQNSNGENIQKPCIGVAVTSASNASASPCPTISHGTPPTQPYQSSYGQTFGPANSPASISQTIPCTSPNQSKPINSNRQTPPLPRSFSISTQETNITRPPHLPYPPMQQQQQLHPNSHYGMGGRLPGFYPSSYPTRPSMHPMACSSNVLPCRPLHFQPSSTSMNTGSMPPPAAPLVGGPTSNQLTQSGVNNAPNQQTFTPGLPYSISNSTPSSVYGPSVGPTHNSHSSWDQDLQSTMPTYSQVSNSLQQFPCRPCPPYTSPVDRVLGYPPSGANSNPVSVPHNGPQIQSYLSNQPSYHSGHQHLPYPYPPTQNYHSQTQYSHLYGPPGVIPSSGGSQQHGLQQTQNANNSVPPTQYPPSCPISVGASMPSHVQMGRDPYHPHYPHDVVQPSVSSANENFTQGSFPIHPNNGSPSTATSGLRLPVMNSLSKTGNLSGKLSKTQDTLAHSMTSNVTPGSPLQVTTPNQLPSLGSGDAIQNISSPPSSQQGQQRTVSQIVQGHSQLQQYSAGQSIYPLGAGGVSGGSFFPPGSGASLQNSPSFPSFQQHYRGASPHNLPNTASNIHLSGSLYPGGLVRSEVNPVHPPQAALSQVTPHSISTQSLGGFHKLLEMGSESERRPWLEHYVHFMDELGKPLIGLPQVVKQPLDLYRFYVAVRERGGVLEVIKNRKWKEVSLVVNINASASAAYTLRKNYCKYLLDYEYQFDRGGSDPRPILAHIEALSGKKKKLAMAGDGDSNSLSGITTLAPSSPAGSHSSASSSLLPPGSSGASLSGGPSGTAGSAASDSQLGPPSQHQRFSDQGQPGSVSTVPESPNGALNVPSPAMPSVQNSSACLPPTNLNTIPSPQRPPSGTTVNGYLNSTDSVPESNSRSNSNLPWASDGGHSDANTLRHRQMFESTVTSSGRIHQPSSVPVSMSPIISAEMPSTMNFTVPVCVSASTDIPMQQHQNANAYSTPGVLTENICIGAQSSPHPRLNHRATSFTTTVPIHNVGNADSISMYRMHHFRPSATSQVSPYLPVSGLTSFGPTSVSANNSVPAHLVHHHGQRPGYVATIFKRLDQFVFPSGSIEATQIEPMRHRRYRTKDLGPISPFKVLMALRSGLTAEVSWALNCLNIILRDDNSMDFVTPNSLPGLLTSLVEIWRHTLGELFDHDLFVTSLELPTDLSSLSSVDGTPKSSTDTGYATSQSPCKNGEKCHEIHSPDKTLNGLCKLERDIVKLATKHGLSITSLRSELRRLMRRCGDPKSNKSQMRLRNGLVFKLENLSNLPNNSTVVSESSANNGTTSLSITSSVLSRTRKRGKNITSTVSNATAVSSNLSRENYSNTVSNLNNFVSLNKQDGLSMWTWSTPQIISVADSLRSPEAFSNLRDLALYAIDSLVEEEKSVETEKTSLKAKSMKNLITKPTKSHHSPSKAVSLLHKLIFKGGGDTTCHIMPPFGALAYRSAHWTNNAEGLCNKSEEDFVNQHESLRQTQTVTNDGSICLKKQWRPIVDGEPLLKRARHNLEMTHCTISSKPTDGAIIAVKGTDPVCCLNHKGSDISDNDELDLLQLIDENGRCPLRAREELVYQGSTCLWPDNSEADSNEARAVRCLCVSTVLRNLSFITPSEHYLCNQKGILTLVGRLILLGHDHVGPEDTWQTLEDKTKSMESSRCCWWTPTWLEDMRENALVLLVNISGYLELVNFDESIVRPILEGLLHWITCTTAAATDPSPGHRTLSPRRLALEAINRLCVHETNVDLLLSTPTNEDVLTRLFDRLANWLALQEDQVTRELALSTMHYLAGSSIISFNNPSVTSVPGKVMVHDNSTSSSTTYIGATLLANAKPCPIASLLAFIEAAEATTRQVIDHYGVQALQERPELMGTSLEMVRRAGALLDRLAGDPTGRAAFTPDLELRLMDLVTSRVLDATVAHLLCGALQRLFPATQSPQIVISKPTIPPIPSLSVVGQLLKLSNNSAESTPYVSSMGSETEIGTEVVDNVTNSSEDTNAKNDPKINSTLPISSTQSLEKLLKQEDVASESVVPTNDDVASTHVADVSHKQIKSSIDKQNSNCHHNLPRSQSAIDSVNLALKLNSQTEPALICTKSDVEFCPTDENNVNDIVASAEARRRKQSPQQRKNKSH